MRNPGSFGLISILFLISSASLEAQLLTNPVQDHINRTSLLNSILSNARATEMSQRAQTSGTAANAGTSPGAGKGSTPADATKFTRAAGLLLPKVLAQKTAGGLADQRRAEQAFAAMVQLYDQTARKDGFPADDLAYAFEYFVVNSYMTVHDLHNVPYEKDPRVKLG